MNYHLFRQLLVASAPQLAAISAGGITCFPNILLQQLKASDSPIQLDVHLTSWLGSTHGLAGIFACLIPAIMQCKGRKFTFILSCLIGIIGWIIVYFAESANALIIAEAFHGLSANSVITVSLLTISEMVHPRFRIISMNMYIVSQGLGMTLVVLVGRCVHWKTAGLIICCFIVLAFLISFTWPESPAWLAYKGDFEKCEEVFKWLRGSDAESQKELYLLISSQKELISERIARDPFKLNKNRVRSVWLKIMQKDFYLPCMHMFVLLCCAYWSGMMAVLIYTMDMLQHVTSSESTASTGVIIIYTIVIFGNVLGTTVLKYYDNKTVIVPGGIGVAFFMFSACIISYLQDIKILSSDSHLCMYCLIGYTVSFNLGTIPCIFSLAAEVMPVKHRGIGGAINVIIIAVLHFSSLKLSPYLFIYIKPWGTFLLYAINATLCMLFIWRYVPETKNRTLQEIEDFYNNGRFMTRYEDDNVLEKINDSIKSC